MQDIRKENRNKRRALTHRQQQFAAEHIARLVCRQPFFLRAQRIGFYLPNDGEIGTSILLDVAMAAGKKCFLPTLHPLKFNRLYFAEYNPSTPMAINHFGILEPDIAKARLALTWTLDTIFMPLVAFDRGGSRIGMGGGFYDRTLSFKQETSRSTPTLIGLAHSCQETDRIERHHWDIPLDIIATDREIICARQR